MSAITTHASARIRGAARRDCPGMLDLTYRLAAAALLALLPACIITTESDDDDATDGSSDTEDTEDTEDPDSSGSSTGPADTAGASSGGGDETSGGDSTGSTSEPGSEAFFESIAGLWVAPVTSWTSAGNFPTMNMDVRAASDGVLFSRVDLDEDNSLRFAFALEDHGGEARLTFRNGGEFLGILRDTRTVLHESDGTVWRFCALSGGCEYVDARFDFSGEDSLQLDVDVLGMRHIEWSAVRREARPLGGAFPTPPVQPSDAPFPPMPTLEVHASWDVPLEEAADVWLVLSDTACGLNPLVNCVPSRFMKAEAAAGATSVELVVEQIHAGQYSANAVLDRNRNMAAGILLPDTGDGVSFPLDAPTTVPTSGTGTLDLLLNTTL